MSFLAVAFFLSGVARGGAALEWSVRGGRFSDLHGRERFFHGVNVVYKSAPYVPITSEDGPLSFTARDAELLRRLGMNGLRLGVMWGGVEPAPGAYNQSYMEELKKIVRMCEGFDIQVFLDFHQDALSEVFCGEGIPWWAALSYGPGYRQFPAPLDEPYDMRRSPHFSGSYRGARVPASSDCEKHGYAHYMGTYALSRNYEDLYVNGRGLRDRLADFWRYIAKEFKGDSNVVGFELMNEPASVWPRNYTDFHFLQPMYEALEEAIHEIDASRILLFEPVCWANGFPDTGQAVPTGLSRAPGGERALDRSVFAYHYYDLPRQYHEAAYFESRIQAARGMGVAGMVTEFELENVVDDSDEEHFGHVMDAMDWYLQSWLAWTYKGYDPTGYLRPDDLPFTAVCTGCRSGLYPDLPRSEDINWATAKALARTYAQAVQGHARSMRFDRETGAFNLTYELDPAVPAPTRIYVNRELGGGLHSRYVTGVDVQVSIGLSWSLDRTILTVWPRAGVSRRDAFVLVAPKVLRIQI
eukprot:CAMPEP_0179096102 /NCGR_PEP_ID=MMETSP0796-20121207/44159_1 /TAXON_ID=73915 /ORGANISM="Pyrodinium bahamense, Strain pbaha01" /LENGTH=525 /DNA_ID=CAMNT_0020793807 /DNA_START=1 /DNA_END=1578 /DNA_ORIENTATION=-